MSSERELDIVVFGATGFTGNLVAEYLAQRVDGSIRWAIAGRNRAKLDAVKQRLIELDAACERVELIAADKTDAASMLAMTRRTRVVLTTAGPYIHGGDAVVRACVDGGAHYVDITGEPEFVARIRAGFDGPARDAGLRLVSCCGFDSIPHDLGVYHLMQHLQPRAPVTVEGFVHARGALSGGTWRSAVLAMSRLRQKPRSARPSSNGQRRVKALEPRLRYEPAVSAWVFPMPTIDPQIVLRSARALELYGPDFRYGHYGMSRRLSRLAVGAVGLAGMLLLAQTKPTRQWLLDRKQSGQGPSPEERERSWFEVTFVARTEGREVVSQVSGGDPGYGETAKMVAEAALVLVQDEARLPHAAGALTPAVALGQPLLDRLIDRGIRFELVAER